METEPFQFFDEASPSEPYTSELNGEFFIYVSIDCSAPRVDSFVLQTSTSGVSETGWQGETLGRSSWRVKFYCTRAGSYEDKPGYLQNAEDIH